MATNVADLVATLRMDAGQFNRTAQQVSGQAQSLSSRLGGIGTALKAAFSVVVVKQVLDFGAAMFRVGMESEAFGRKYRAVFGESTAELDAWVTAHHEAFGVAEDEVQGYLAQIGNLLTGMGMAADEAGKQATKILDLAGAWSAWSGGQISVQDASDKLVKGMMGQTRGLIELGLKVTEQEVNARMAAQGLDQLTGAEASRAQQQVMWTLIQEKSTTAVGAYDEALGGAYGASMSMSTAVDEMKDAIGGMVVRISPAIAKLADFVSVIAEVVEGIRGIGGASRDINSVIGTMLTGSLEEAQIAAKGLRDGIDFITMVRGVPFAADVWQLTRNLDDARDTVSQFGAAWNDLFGFLAPQVDGATGATENLFSTVGRLRKGEDGLIATTTGLVAQTNAWTIGQRAATSQTNAAIAAMRNYSRAQLEATSTVAAAVGAVDRYNQAQAAAATATGDDLNKALMDQAMAAWEAQAALDALRFDPTALAASIAAIGLALNMTDAEVRALLASLGVLNNTKVSSIFAPGGDTGSLLPGGGRAAGGPVSAMTPYVVGERGPELFVPGASGTIIPDGKYSSSSGTTQIINVHVAGSVIAAQELARIVEDQMIRSSRRGGSSEVY